MLYLILKIFLALIIIAGAIFFALGFEDEFTLGIRVYAVLIAIISFAYVGFTLERAWDPLGWKPYSFEIAMMCFWYGVIFFFAEKWDMNLMRALHFGMAVVLIVNLLVSLFGVGTGLMVKITTMIGMAPIIIAYSPLLIGAFIIWYVFDNLF